MPPPPRLSPVTPRRRRSIGSSTPAPSSIGSPHHRRHPRDPLRGVAAKSTAPRASASAGRIPHLRSGVALQILARLRRGGLSARLCEIEPLRPIAKQRTITFDWGEGKDWHQRAASEGALKGILGYTDGDAVSKMKS